MLMVYGSVLVVSTVWYDVLPGICWLMECFGLNCIPTSIIIVKGIELRALHDLHQVVVFSSLSIFSDKDTDDDGCVFAYDPIDQSMYFTILEEYSREPGRTICSHTNTCFVRGSNP